MSDESKTTDDQVDESPVKDPVEMMIESLATTEHTCDLEIHPVKIKNKQGVVETYTLRELDGPGRGEYSNAQAQVAKFGGDGKMVGLKNIKLLEPKLVSLSLLDPKGKPVTEQFVIDTFPGKLINKLAMIARRISGLDDKAEARAKNS